MTAHIINTASLKKAHCALGTIQRPHGRKARKAATRVVTQSRKAARRQPGAARST